MLDGLQRDIRYLRVSVTDRCDLRCVYCMPEDGVPSLCHEEILRYEEIIRLAGIFAGLGITKIRLTGGEPLVRRDLERLVAGLHAVPGIETVAMTTNGVMLQDKLPALVRAGLSGVNISLDTLDEAGFFALTRRRGLHRVLEGIRAAAEMPGLAVKLNCVPTDRNRDEIPALVRFAAGLRIPIRFIELMPIGEGAGMAGLPERETAAIIEESFGDMTPLPSGDPREKCRYASLSGGGTVGFISAVSHAFCHGCDRVRLTADGFLKTCLQYDIGVSLRPLMDGSDDELRAAIRAAILEKPVGHHFGGKPGPRDEKRKMSRIGG